MDNQEKSFPQSAQEINEALPTLDEGLLEGVTGGAGGGCCSKKSISVLPPIRKDEEYMRTKSGSHITFEDAHAGWKLKFKTPEERDNAPYRIAAKMVDGVKVAYKYPWTRPTE